MEYMILIGESEARPVMAPGTSGFEEYMSDWMAHNQKLIEGGHWITGSPVVALNHAVAVSMADGPRAGLAMLERVTGLEGYHLFHAARGELLARAGETDAAAAALRTARSLALNPAEQRHLDRRIAALG